MAERALDRITKALDVRGKVVKHNGPNRAKAQCPAHDDNNPSLSLTQIEGSVLMKCWSGGCDNKDIVDALGLTMADLYDDREQKYRYDDGRVVRRYYEGNKKRFTQYGTGKTPQLYRASIVAASTGLAIFLVEGEQDVHALESLGLTATTAPQGATNFHLVDVTPLKGKKVIAIPDQDAAGHKWAAAVRSRLHGVAESLAFYAPKVGKDAADHVAAGYVFSDLTKYDPFASQTPQEPTGTLSSQSDTSDTSDTDVEALLLANVRDGAWLDSQNFPPLKYAVPGLLPEGYAILIGPPKAGKSWLILDMLLGVARGGRVLGRLDAQPARRVLYLALEDGDRRMQDRCRKLLVNQSIPASFHYITKVAPGNALATITAFLNRHPDTALVVIDTLGKVMPPAAQGESAYQRDYRVGGRLKEITDSRPGIALVVVHHDRKAASEDFVDSVSGTQGIAGAADTIVVLARKRQSNDGILKITGRDVPENEYALKLIDGCAWQLDGSSLAEAADRARKREDESGLSDTSAGIVDFVRSHGESGVTAKVVRDKFGPAADQYLKRRVEDGRMVKLGRGQYMVPSAPLSEVSEVSEPQVEAPLDIEEWLI